MKLERFREIKKRIIEIIEHIDTYISQDQQPTEQEIKELNDEFISLQKELENADLSSIDYKEWEGMPLIALSIDGGDRVLDLSKTHANIDFSLISEILCDKLILSGCNVKNLFAIKYDEEMFSKDEAFILAHPEFFPSKSIPEEIHDKYYHREIDLGTLKSYPELLECIHSADYFEFSTKRISKFVGFDNLITFIKEYPELIDVISIPIFYIENIDEGQKTYAEARQALFKIFMNNLSHVHNGFSFLYKELEVPELSQLTDELISCNPEYFLTDLDIPREISEKFYRGEFDISDIRLYRDALKDKNLLFGCRLAHIFLELEIINKIFGDLITYIDIIPPTLDSILLSGSFDKKEYSSINEFVSERISAHLTSIRDYAFIKKIECDFDELYLYSYYVPVDKIFGDDPYIIALINKYGFKAIKEFHKKYDNVLGNNLCITDFSDSNLRVIAELYKELLDAGKEPETLNDLIKVEVASLIDNLAKHNNGHSFVCTYETKAKLFYDFFPDMFLSPDELQYAYEICNDDKILGRILSSIAGNYDDLFDLVNKYPQLIPIFLQKKFNTNTYSSNSEIVEKIDNLYKKLGKKDFLTIVSKYGKALEIVIENYKKALPFGEMLASIDNKEKFLNDFIYEKKLYYQIDVRILPESFRKEHPELYLSVDVPEKLKEKFYSRTLDVKDFIDNPELLKLFNNNNIAYGFAESMAWIVTLYANETNFEEANYKRMKIIMEYSKITDPEMQAVFSEYVLEIDGDIDKMKIASNVISMLEFSNSSEMMAFRGEIAKQVLRTEKPLEKLREIEDLFIRNNIPVVGKIYSCFEILHPDFQGFDFSSPIISPVLKRYSVERKKMIVFSDLIKAAFGSNNRSVIDYLENIEFASKLYEKIKSGQIEFEQCSEMEKRELVIFSKRLATLHNNTLRAKADNDIFVLSGDVLADIYELSKKISPNGTLDYDLADRIVKMFCGFAGFHTLEQAKTYIVNKVKAADLRNRRTAQFDVVLRKGDLVKGIGKIKYLGSILQNGSVSKEFLGANADSDFTPLDTDLSLILSEEGTIREKIDSSISKDYGPIWFVLKKDDRFSITRDKNGICNGGMYDPNKLELFQTTCEGHYGIRTGFSSTDIDYIVAEEPFDSRIGLEIAINGFYIPVANMEGKIIFTPEDYDKLREKMSGLSYFGETTYTFSPNLVTEETEYLAQQIEDSMIEVETKREKIISIIKKALEELGLHLKTSIDGDLTEGFVELIDTGSTGRGTNKPGDGDFDFMMRIDRAILSSPQKMAKLKTTILKNFGGHHSNEQTGDGDFRLKGVKLDDDTDVDVDISFATKTDKMAYSTDMALKDRLETIRKQDPQKYKYVIANILLAKQVLKKAHVYKAYRSDKTQGGLGGVGVENWILQHGGSFIDAARSFIAAAEGKEFSEFVSTYRVWDFGDNHLAEKKGLYPHDNFVFTNMSSEGYTKMVECLKDFLKDKKTVVSVDTQDQSEKSSKLR